MSVRDRIKTLEGLLARSHADGAEARRQMFIDQLPELTDRELDRLETITLRVIEIDGDDGFMLAPTDCLHLRDFIAYVDRDEAGYLAQFIGERDV